MSEQYQTYLCSREWGLRREAVIKRSGGTCERCKKIRGEAVHHLTYARIYNEPLTDLIHLCKGCHDYQHGRSHDDPAALWIYMAGPVINERLVSVINLDGSESMEPMDYICRWREVAFDSDHGNQEPGGKSNNEKLISSLICPRQLIYAGPTIDSCGHGQAQGPKHSYDSDLHERDRRTLVFRCLDQVKGCDAIFAWIDRKETVGTVVEIATAYHCNKTRFLAFMNKELEDYFYFVTHCSSDNSPSYQIVEPLIEMAWSNFVAWIEQIHTEHLHGGRIDDPRWPREIHSEERRARALQQVAQDLEDERELAAQDLEDEQELAAEQKQRQEEATREARWPKKTEPKLVLPEELVKKIRAEAAQREAEAKIRAEAARIEAEAVAREAQRAGDEYEETIESLHERIRKMRAEVQPSGPTRDTTTASASVLGSGENDYGSDDCAAG